MLGLAFAAAAALMAPATAAPAAGDFAQWVARFRAKALARGISGETYDRAMDGLRPDTTGLAAIRTQPEFNEQIWQYLNRRVSDWRVIAGKEKAKEYAALFSRIEKDFGVERSVMLGVWGVESAYGDPVVQQHHMRPVIPSLATLAWAEPRRRDYWEKELINALTIIQRGWSTPAEMIGSWAGAMGHTQWMPEVWLQCRHRLRPRRQGLAVRPARRCARIDGALSRRARQIPARRALGLRGAHAGGR